MVFALFIARRSGGNPLFLSELAAGEPDGRPGPLPRSFADAVLSRVNRLPDGVVAVAEVAATTASAIRFDLLHGLTGRGEDELLEALRRLVDAGLVVEDGGDRFRFRHELIREAVDARLLARERRRIHARIFELLRAGGDDAALTRHAALADQPADVARHAARGARSRLDRGFSLDALALAELGLSAVDDAASQMDLSEVAAIAARNAGLYDDAAQHARARADAARRATDTTQEVAALLLLAELHVASGLLDEAAAVLDAAAAAAGDLPAARARCAALTGRLHMLAEEDDEAIEQADVALALIARGHAPDVQAATFVTKGTALAGRGDLADGLALIERGRRAAGQQGDTFTVARALLNGLACLQEGGDPDEAWKAYREARRFVQERDLASIAGNIARCGADLAVRAGDLQQARRILDTQLGDELDPVEAAAIAAKAGVLALEAKDDTHAVALLDAHRADLDRIEQHWVRTYLAHLRVAVASRTEHPAEAEEALERYPEATSLAGHARRPDRAADAARYALHGGASVQAVSAFLRAVLIEADDAPSWWRTQLEVAVAAATGDHERVVDAGVPSRGPWPHLDADAYLAVARSLEVLGDTALATRHAYKARDLLDRWPGWRRDDTDALIQQLEHLDGPAITERQHEVLALVAEGLTNQQIGLRLAISPRTVAVHVSNLLRRTERASRTDLAAWALREGVLR